MKRILIIALLFTLQAKAEISEQDFAELQAKVEELELSNYLRNYKINGSLETNYYNYDYKSKTSENQKLRLFGIRSAIDIAFDVNDKIDFYTTFGMSKYWQVDGRAEGTGRTISGETEKGTEPWEISQTSGYGYEGANVKVDRAYFNYKYSDNLLFSIGRLPLNKGPLFHQFDGKQRTGTVPRSARNSVFDGIGLTYDLSRFIPEEDSLKLKLFYTPWQNVSATTRNKQIVTPGSTTNIPGPNARVQSNTLGAMALVEYYKRNMSWLRQFEFHAFTTYYEDFWWNQYKQIYHGMTYTVVLGFSGIANTGLNFSAILNGTRWKTEDDKDSTIKGEGFLFNLNYKFANTMVLGVEFINTNKSHYADDFANTDVESFYKIKSGEGFHAWYAFPIYDNLRSRLGTYQYEYGPTNKAEVDTYYAKLLLDF